MIAENKYGSFKFTVTVLVGKPEGAEIVMTTVLSKRTVVEETLVDGKVVERVVKEDTTEEPAESFGAVNFEVISTQEAPIAFQVHEASMDAVLDLGDMSLKDTAYTESQTVSNQDVSTAITFTSDSSTSEVTQAAEQSTEVILTTRDVTTSASLPETHQEESAAFTLTHGEDSSKLRAVDAISKEVRTSVQETQIEEAAYSVSVEATSKAETIEVGRLETSIDEQQVQATLTMDERDVKDVTEKMSLEVTAQDTEVTAQDTVSLTSSVMEASTKTQVLSAEGVSIRADSLQVKEEEVVRSSSSEEDDEEEGQAPKFAQPPEPVFVDFGETIKLSCRVSGWQRMQCTTVPRSETPLKTITSHILLTKQSNKLE